MGQDMNSDALDLIKWAEVELERADIECSRRDAEFLFMDSFDVRWEDIYLMDDFRPTTQHLNLFKHNVKTRATRYPLQYTLKSDEFMGLPFALEEGVFIPRQETELLVEKVLEYVKREGRDKVHRNAKNFCEVISILDIGTGCGNIAISLTKNITGCKIIASDISDKALEVASKNARLHGVEKNIKFIKSDLFVNISFPYFNYFDIIISNPPYVHRKDLEYLQSEITYEDVSALDGGEDGLYFYRRILNEGTRYLKKGGIFAFEIGYDQKEDIVHLIKNDGRLSEPTLFKDYSGYSRVVIISKRGHPTRNSMGKTSGVSPQAET